MVRNTFVGWFAFVLLLSGLVSADSLVAHWELNEGSGSTANDTSVNSNTGFLYNMTESDWVDGYESSALDFDGNDDYIYIADSSSISVGNDNFTLSAWIYPHTTSGLQTVIAKVNGNSEKEYCLTIDNGKILFEIESSANNGQAQTDAIVTTGNWQHICATYELSTTNVTIYYNGTPQTLTSKTISGPSNIQSDDLFIGKRDGSYDDSYFDGLIDDVRIYDYAMSAEEIYHTLHPENAWGPFPVNGEMFADVQSDLNWSSGDNAISHDIYFGTNENDVVNAQRLAGDIDGDGAVNILDLSLLVDQWLTNPGAVNPSADVSYNQYVDIQDFAAMAADWDQNAAPEFKGNQNGTTFNLGTLEYGTTYYWRVDEVNSVEPDSPWKGDVWSFRAENLLPEQASNPSPIDGTAADIDITLSWTAGYGATTHNVYFGTTAPGTFQNNQSETTFDPGTLSDNTTYYWRIDEVNAYGTTTGVTWSFTTARDLYADTWVATDALGRSLPGYDQCGPPRSGKTVALFYYIWHGQHDGDEGPYDVTKMISDAGGMPVPQWDPDDPAYQTYTKGVFHHWGESELGYYRSEDPYVIRKHAHMLANAGVDVIIFDVTNAWTYKDNYLALCSVFSDIRSEGGTTPQIAFMTNWNADANVQSVYDNLYSKGLYSDLWFYWKGKPLILSPLQGDPDPAGGTINHSQEVLDFFNMRYSWTWMDVTRADVWKWMDFYPQQYGWHESYLIPEQVSVSCGMVPHGYGVGRSFHNGSQPSPNDYGLTGTQDQGLMFAEQWNRLNQIDPELILITQWNEWIAQRQIFKGNGTDPVTHFIGNLLQPGDTWFIDEFNQEFSRDIEPMKGGHTDNYYYQMIDGIRRYKGVKPPQAPSAAKTITIDGNFADWVDVGPEYRDHVADTTSRDWPGWGSEGIYTDNTGRNDFITAKVARDNNYIYFYIETEADITDWNDSNWMMLFINADQNYSNGWEGYDYVINMGVTNSTRTTLKSTSGGWNWTTVNANISYQFSGNKMEIRVPRSDIGQGSGSDSVAFDFHWADNIQNDNDIIEFSISGDSAPDRRFNYRYDTDL